jgi:cytochrome c oxidase assembly protein subunit 20
VIWTFANATSIGQIMMCCHYAVGTWVGVSVLSYQYCQYYRSKEKEGMRQARELMDKKRATIEAKREARRRAKEEWERQEEEKRKEEERRKTWSYWLSKNKPW